jgi:hypothetical protein
MTAAAAVPTPVKYQLQSSALQHQAPSNRTSRGSSRSRPDPLPPNTMLVSRDATRAPGSLQPADPLQGPARTGADDPGLLLVVRLGIYIPMPGIDRVAFQDFLQRGGQLIGFLDIFTGRRHLHPRNLRPGDPAVSINASIILQLLTASPAPAGGTAEERRRGRPPARSPSITRYVALGRGILQSAVFARDPAPVRHRRHLGSWCSCCRPPSPWSRARWW